MSYWGHGEYHKADWGVNENQPIEHFMHKCCDDRDSAKGIGMGSIFTDSLMRALTGVKVLLAVQQP